jgi:spermidine synthase
MAGSNLSFPIRSDKLSMSVAVKQHIVSERTAFQSVDIYETEALGKMLFLDGHVQLSTFDEFAYHEALVHIPLLNIDSPRRALVVGGGDGGVVRELARDSRLEQIDMVDIDERVVRLCELHLPELNAGAFHDQRVSLWFEDAFAFVKRGTEPYDLIVLDVTDVYEDEDGELSERLFTKEFYADCLAALTQGGMAVTQADNHVFCPYSMRDVLAEFGAVFPRVGSYQALVPSFGGFSGYVWASRGASIGENWPAHAASIPFRYLNPTTYSLALVGGMPGGLFSADSDAV